MPNARGKRTTSGQRRAPSAPRPAATDRATPATGEAARRRSSADTRPVDKHGPLQSPPVPTPPALARPAVNDATRDDGDSAYGFERVVVGRRRQHRIDVKLVLGSIAEVDTSAYVLGAFRDVAPSGAARALDEGLDGAIAEFTARRMLGGNVGEIFMLPVGRHPLRADLVLFAGLGPFDTFNGGVQTLVAENVIRTFVRTRVEEFATVLLGAGSGLTAAASLRHLLRGFIKGLRDADREHRFRGITLCEKDSDRYLEMKRELFRLSSTSLFDDVEVTFDEVRFAAPAQPARAPRRAASGPDPVYLLVRQERGPPTRVDLSCSVLGAGAAAAVITRRKEFSIRELDARLMKVESRALQNEDLGPFGAELADLVLHPDVAAALCAMQDHHIVVVHDRPSSRIPWETITLDGWSPAAQHGLSRRYMSDNLSVAKWLEERRQGPTLSILLVSDPTGDLVAARREGDIIGKLFGTHPYVKVYELRGKEATKPRLCAEFQSGKYDVIHYAGHAFFDRVAPVRSGILCHGAEVLGGTDLAGIGSLPSLVFFNACEAGRIRRAPAGTTRRATRIEESGGLAEAFLRGGVANYVGTYWPVADASAEAFAGAFYGSLVRGDSIGQALGAGRKAVLSLNSVDWADYIHYGSYDFALKQVPA